MANDAATVKERPDLRIVPKSPPRHWRQSWRENLWRVTEEKKSIAT
jgi:hypothetical protein